MTSLTRATLIFDKYLNHSYTNSRGLLCAGGTQAATVTASDCNSVASAISAAGSGGTVQIQGILTCSAPITISSSVTLAGISSNAANDGFNGQALTNLFIVQGSGTQVNFNFLTLTNAKVRGRIWSPTFIGAQGLAGHKRFGKLAEVDNSIES